jgi:hypothetical protein
MLRVSLEHLWPNSGDREGKMPTPDETLTAFFDVFTSGDPGATKVDDLMDLFCLNGNDPQGNLAIPSVGIGHHGPDFIGVTDVESLWTQFLVKSFQNFMFAPANIVLQHGLIAPPRLYSNDDYPTQSAPIPMIGVQCTLSGDFFDLWFQPPQKGSSLPDHSSNPLSGIKMKPPNPIPVSLEACAVFAFDATADSLITNLFIYLDRYKLMHVVSPGSGAILAGFNRALVERKEVLERIAEHHR